MDFEMYNELIIDLETVDTQPTAAIVAIAAVAFSFDHNHVQTFYRTVDKASSIESGGTEDHNTLKWWEKQSDEAKSIFTDPNRVTLQAAMDEFKAFALATRKSNPALGLNVWGNDNTFDVTICEQTFKRLNILCPWKYWEGKSIRTLVYLGQRIGTDPKAEIKRIGVHHNALDDCFHEIHYCKAIMACFKE